MGVALHGSGFILDSDTAARMRPQGPSVIKPYLAGRDLLQARRERYLIDFSGMTQEEARRANPAAFQHVVDYVKPERDHNNRKALKELWWRYGWERPVLRRAMSGLSRYIATTETSKHRPFQFVDSSILCDHSIVCIALDDPAALGILSSTIHVTWALGAGGTLEDRPRYNKTVCFDRFAFPASTREQIARISDIAEQLDAHRKRQQDEHPGLTVTGMYNVLERLRSREVLNDKERIIHGQGLVSVLRQLHDELDEAVLNAYGWDDLIDILRIAHGNDAPPEGQNPEDAKRAFDEAVLERLVALNAERAAEEARGHIRWLRPAFQNPDAEREPEQTRLATDRESDAIEVSIPVATEKQKPWPKDTVDQVRAVADLLAASPIPLSIDEIGERFTARGPWKRRLPKLIEMLVALGRAQEQDGRIASM